MTDQIIDLQYTLHMMGVPLDYHSTTVGINLNTNGCSCEEHHTCGCVLTEDTLVRL